MNTVVRRRGRYALKRHSMAGDRRKALLFNTARLVESGVRTPRIINSSKSSELVYPWLHGMDGKQSLKKHGIDLLGAHREILVPIIVPLVDLHQIPTASLRLDYYNPWRKVIPRLKKGPSVRRQADQCLKELIRIQHKEPFCSFPQPSCTIHGDYHIGQLLFPDNYLEPWLLDLDDLSKGRPESDVANFAAHYCSSSLCGEQFSWEHALAFCDRLTDVYHALSGTRLLVEYLRYYLAASLLRRGLKLSLQPGNVALSKAVIAGCWTIIQHLRKEVSCAQ